MDGTMQKKLPVGVENFEKLRTEGFYYVDKTDLLKALLLNWGEVNLFTRPRRFGKSLNISLLKSFFSLDSDKTIFEGLKISKEEALCEKYMGKFPVICLSLKGIYADQYETARMIAAKTINEEARRHQYLLGSDKLTQKEKEDFFRLLEKDMDDATLFGSIRFLSELLARHHSQKVIILIDEYDVPLSKAFEKGYYDRMLTLVRNMFEQALKTNDSMYFAVLTGCLRISKESIFTGLNNLKILSVADAEFNEYFGFTDEEVKELLGYYDLSEFYGTVKEWYDGYHFGDIDVYCPWDVICYCDRLRADRNAAPRNYWLNTSGNDIVRRFVKGADSGAMKRELEKLVAGEAVTKEICQELTYRELYDSIDNIWSVLFTTGYLTQRGKMEGDYFSLVIPNMEIRNIFTKQIMEYFKDIVRQDGEALNLFCEALKSGDAAGVERYFGGYLKKAISIRDASVKKSMKENFYHGILLGLLGFKDTWGISSNRESGDGYSDILIETEDEETGIVIEVKYREDGNLEAGCREALRQIEENGYEEQLRMDGMEAILKYGIACCKKKCRVMLEQV